MSHYLSSNIIIVVIYLFSLSTLKDHCKYEVDINKTEKRKNIYNHIAQEGGLLGNSRGDSNHFYLLVFTPQTPQILLIDYFKERIIVTDTVYESVQDMTKTTGVGVINLLCNRVSLIIIWNEYLRTVSTQ